MCIKVVWNVFINYWKINKPYNMQNLKSSLILPLRSSFFLFLKWLQISGLTLWTLFHLYVSDPETIAIFLASLDLKIVNIFCQNMVCAPSVHKNQEFLQLESLWIIIFSLILPKVPIMFALSSMFCRFWFYIVTYTLFSSFRLNLSISSYYTPPLQFSLAFCYPLPIMNVMYATDLQKIGSN